MAAGGLTRLGSCPFPMAFDAEVFAFHEVCSEELAAPLQQAVAGKQPKQLLQHTDLPPRDLGPLGSSPSCEAVLTDEAVPKLALPSPALHKEQEIQIQELINCMSRRRALSSDRPFNRDPYG